MAGFFDVGIDEIDDAFDERMAEAAVDGLVAPGFVGHGVAAGSFFHGFGKLDESFGGVGAAVEKDVFDALQKIARFLRRRRVGRR